MQIQPKPPTVKAPAECLHRRCLVRLHRPAERNHPGSAPASFGRSRGAWNAWHAHAMGQTVHVIDGIGRMLARGDEVIEIRPGDTIHTPPGKWHWHGAAPDHFMTHLTV